MKTSALSRSTKPLKRSPLRTKPDAAKLAVKPYKRTCRVPGCCVKFTTFDMRCWWCSPEHGVLISQTAVMKKREKEAKAERANDRKLKAEQMPLKKHLKLTEAVINYYVRLRDYLDGCCSCDKPSHWDGQWHASHFKSVGSNSLLRFHLWNIHKGCSECNRHKAGNLPEYTERLKLKIGAEKVQWLKDHKNGSKDYTAEYLIRMRRIFSKKCKRLEKRLGL